MSTNTAGGWYPDPLKPHQRRYWNGQQWTEWVAAETPAAITTVPVQTNHTFHLLMTVFTCGLWGLVWLLVWAVNQGKSRQQITRSTGGGQPWQDPLPSTAQPAALPSPSPLEVASQPAAPTAVPAPRPAPPPRRNPSGPSA